MVYFYVMKGMFLTTNQSKLTLAKQGINEPYVLDKTLFSIAVYVALNNGIYPNV